MASIVSGLGRLFNPPSSSHVLHTPRGQRQLESVTEEAHTYDLLYPDAGSLQRSQRQAFPLKNGDPSSIAAAANSSDERGGLNIQHPRDVRFIVGQHIGGQSSVLFDTQPPLPSSISRKSLDGEREMEHAEFLRHSNVQRSRTAPHTRQSSLSQQVQSTLGSSGVPLSPVNEMTGFLGRENRRPNTSDGDTIQAQLAREEHQEIDAMLSSIFGATGHRITAGMKVHVKPYTSSQSDAIRPVSPNNPRPGSQRRRTPLTRSTTAEDLPNYAALQKRSPAIQQASRRQSSSILFTKIFYVDSADEGSRPTPAGKGKGTTDLSENTQVTSENRRSRNPLAEHKDKKANRHRTPAFAIAMIIYVPPYRQTNKAASTTRPSPGIGQSHGGTCTENFNLPFSDAFDRSVEYIMAHWDTIMRALSSLEIIVRCEISDALSHLDVDEFAFSDHISSDHPSLKASRIKALPLPGLQLPHGALQQLKTIQNSTEATGKRVISALQIRGVAVGQGRWGVWREEARSVGKWAGGHEQELFFFDLLTAFLGTHTEWLDAMSSKLSHGKRSRSRDRYRRQQSNLVRHRTVIVSQDKMAARRLIFLLSAFLPPIQSRSRPHEEPKFEVSTSMPNSSLSPLISSPLSHQLSFRNSVEKTDFRNSWKGVNYNDTAIIDLDTATELSDDRTITEGQIMHRKNSNLQQPRNSFDAASIRSVGRPITAAVPRFRTASTTTTASVLPEFAIPVAHFSSIAPEPGSNVATEQRPGSSSSIASLALHRTLSKSDSIDHSGTSADSQSTGRWFWSSRRGSPTEMSATPISSAEGLGIFVPQDLRSPRTTDKLSRMVEDVAAGQDTPREHFDALHGNAHTPNLPIDSHESHRNRNMIDPFPLDLSVDENDGVIDVKLPSLGSQASSFESFTSSPRPSRMIRNAVQENQRSLSPSLSKSSTMPVRKSSYIISEVAGWLKKFHQDLSIQAVQPYDTLKEEIMCAMRTEPSSGQLSNAENRNNLGDWTDVCVSLIADITTFTLTRITLRRKNASLSHHHVDALLGLSTKDNPEEEFHEESLIEHDATLTEAIEKILSHSGQSSHIPSRESSRATSRPSSPMPYPGKKSPPHEIPKNECKKTVFGALEQVAKSVRNELVGRDEPKSPQDVETKDPLRDGVRRWFDEVGPTSY